MRRKRMRKNMDRQLLDAIFSVEADWKKLRQIVDHSIDPLDGTRNKLKLRESSYMFLLKEAKHRKISALRY